MKQQTLFDVLPVSDQLLAEVLGSIDYSTLPEGLLDRVNEFVAEYGGCAFCGRPCELLCDYVLGGPIGGWNQCDGETALRVGRLDEYDRDRGLPYIDSQRDLFTCDAPLCRTCATQVGRIFCSGDGGCACERIDRCPVHQAMEEDPRPMEADQAERLRLVTWKAAVLSPPVDHGLTSADHL